MIYKKRSDKKYISYKDYCLYRRLGLFSYAYNRKIRNSLFYCGLVLPDLKISWVVLGLYSWVKYPLSNKIKFGLCVGIIKNKVVRSFIKFKMWYRTTFCRL